MIYYLMRKNEIVTMMEFSDTGEVISVSNNFRNPELKPLCYSHLERGLVGWWKERSIPISQGQVARMLSEKGIVTPNEYLLKNLGLSLIDYYWIKPVDSSLHWEDVNLFENNFKEDLMQQIQLSSPKGSSNYTPNSTLQGELEKSWQIKNGHRVLYKGNHGNLSTESINEVIATQLHKTQGYDNYTEYKLAKIKNKSYDYGCYCKAFTSQDEEFVSAWSIINSRQLKPKEKSIDCFIDVCVKNGIDEKQLRKDLEYQILSDFVLSNRDRHFNNFGVIRDAKTLKFKRLAPLFDSGKSMFVGIVIPYKDEFENIEVNSFENTESKLLKFVTDFSLLDTKKLPSADYVFNAYSKDTQMSKKRIESVCKAYDTKVKMLNC